MAALAVVVVISSWGPAVGQPQQPASDSDWTPTLTPWGEPDLQGLWRYESTIPFERPAEFADRESLTPEEVAQRQEAEEAAVAARLAGADFQEIGRRDPKRVADCGQRIQPVLVRDRKCTHGIRANVDDRRPAGWETASIESRPAEEAGAPASDGLELSAGRCGECLVGRARHRGALSVRWVTRTDVAGDGT